ncbi:hypothetical protein HDIA_4829 [Hartmannibacter diazotrophicus]|uniref:Uncharacterized protein n=1 Tax=Hartmannibacter diazotrophicus TaxID=1482074 RepID=A0A2C9DDX0_9HYPH|nr:hypothetical protein HDIA_4829 [Hartmannibacter diazotrophicus]
MSKFRILEFLEDDGGDSGVLPAFILATAATVVAEQYGFVNILGLDDATMKLLAHGGLFVGVFVIGRVVAKLADGDPLFGGREEARISSRSINSFGEGTGRRRTRH